MKTHYKTHFPGENKTFSDNSSVHSNKETTNEFRIKKKFIKKKRLGQKSKAKGPAQNAPQEKSISTNNNTPEINTNNSNPFNTSNAQNMNNAQNMLFNNSLQEKILTLLAFKKLNESHQVSDKSVTDNNSKILDSIISNFINSGRTNQIFLTNLNINNNNNFNIEINNNNNNGNGNGNGNNHTQQMIKDENIVIDFKNMKQDDKQKFKDETSKTLSTHCSNGFSSYVGDELNLKQSFSTNQNNNNNYESYNNTRKMEYQYNNELDNVYNNNYWNGQINTDHFFNNFAGCDSPKAANNLKSIPEFYGVENTSMNLNTLFPDVNNVFQLKHENLSFTDFLNLNN